MTTVFAIIVVVLAVLSALCSGTETSLFSLGKGTLSRWRETGNRKQQLVARLMDDHHGTLIAILLSNNFVNILMAIVLARMTAKWTTGTTGPIIAGFIATGMLLVFGEVIPKTIAYSNASRLAPKAAGILYPCYRLLNRIGAINSLKYVTGKILNILTSDAPPPAVSAEEYQTFIQLGRSVGIFGEDEADLLSHALKLRAITASQAMTPRTEVDWISSNADYRDVARDVRRYRHRLLPVATESLDEVIGVLAATPFLVAPDHQREDWRSLYVRPAVFMPESTPLTVVLQQLRHKNQRLAMVVDEYGGVEGVLTLEDIIEEIIGEVEDEYDEREHRVTRLGAEHWEISGQTTMEELAETIPELELPESNADTLGGLMADLLGRLPKSGDGLDLGAWHLQVLRTRRRRVLTVEIFRMTPKERQP